MNRVWCAGRSATLRGLRLPVTPPTRATTHARRVGDPATMRQRAPRACVEIHVQAQREDRKEEDADLTQGDDGPSAIALHTEQRGTRSERAGKPRSTRKRACFATCPDATLTCAAREVTFYLAVTSLRRLAVFSQASSQARRASSAGLTVFWAGHGTYDDYGPPPRAAEASVGGDPSWPSARPGPPPMVASEKYVSQAPDPRGDGLR